MQPQVIRFSCLVTTQRVILATEGTEDTGERKTRSEEEKKLRKKKGAWLARKFQIPNSKQRKGETTDYTDYANFFIFFYNLCQSV